MISTVGLVLPTIASSSNERISGVFIVSTVPEETPGCMPHCDW